MTDSEKLDLLLSEMQGMKSEMQGMKSEMQGMKSDIQGMKSEMQDMKSDIQDIRGEVRELKKRVSNIENKVSNIELTLENEISVNIRRVAEGHLDLSRNLHEAMKIDSEKEMLVIRVNMLESELRKIKERLEHTA